jgi:hypothetical protein
MEDLTGYCCKGMDDLVAGMATVEGMFLEGTGRKE